MVGVVPNMHINAMKAMIHLARTKLHQCRECEKYQSQNRGADKAHVEIKNTALVRNVVDTTFCHHPH